LIAMLLVKDPLKRITASEAMQQEWFKEKSATSSRKTLTKLDSINEDLIKKLIHFQEDNMLKKEMKMHATLLLKEADLTKLTGKFKN